METEKEMDLFYEWFGDDKRRDVYTLALLDAWIARARLANQWQPIDTAPDDETLVIATDFLQFELMKGQDARADCCTHWMPLPEPQEGSST